MKPLTILAIALAAGLVGAGVMWSIGRDAVSTAGTFVAEADAAPSVANLPPAQAALVVGNWHYDRQRWAQAIEQYEAAIRLGLDNADVRTDLGNCYRFLGQPQKALELYQLAQRQNPQHEHSLFNQAGLYAEVLHEPAKAVATAQEFVRRFPQSSGASAAQQMIARLNDRSTSATRQLADWLAEDNAAKPGSAQ